MLSTRHVQEDKFGIRVKKSDEVNMECCDLQHGVGEYQKCPCVCVQIQQHKTTILTLKLIARGI